MRGQLEHTRHMARLRHVGFQVKPTACEDHPALDGPFTLLEHRDGRRIAYVETQHHSRLLTTRSAVRAHEEQYGFLRAHAFSPRESLAYVEKLLGET